MHTEAFAFFSHVSFPAESRPFLDGHPGFDNPRQNAIAIRLILCFEQPPAGHADDASLDSLAGKLLVCLDAQRNLAAGSEQENVGVAVGRVGEDVRTALQASCGGVFCSVQGGQCLTRKDESHWRVVLLHDDFPGLDHLTRIAWADH